MQEPQRVLELLSRKKALFSEYREATDAMLECAPADMEYYITKREQLTIPIDEINASLREACAASPGSSLREAVENSCAYASLTPDLQRVFMAAQEVLGLMRMTADSERAVLQRAEYVKTESETEIRRLKSTPKVTRYLQNALSGGGEDFSRLKGKA